MKGALVIALKERRYETVFKGVWSDRDLFSFIHFGSVGLGIFGSVQWNRRARVAGDIICPFGVGSFRYLCASKSEDLEAEAGNSSSESCDLLYICTDVYRNNIYIWPMDGLGIIIQLMSVGA
jgi:hypothetical protein